MAGKIVDLKGSVLTVTMLQLHSADVEECKAALSEKVAPARDFFVGATVIIEPKQDPEDPMFLALMVEHLHQLGMIPIGVRSNNEIIKEQAQFTGLGVFPEEDVKQRSRREPEPAKAEAEPVAEQGLVSAMTINRPVRSGQQIYAKDRDLVIMGSVNPGAEVIADGNVTVYGHMRGKVIAGYSGNMDATIIVKQMDPELVCISGIYRLADDIPAEFKNNWVVISQSQQAIEFQSL